MRAAEHALRFLSACGVSRLYGIPGGTVNPFYDALHDVPGLTPVIARHEAAAAYMAASDAKLSGGIGVVIASSGPGSANLLTGVASAKREGTPLLILTGQVPQAVMGLGGAQESSPWTMDMVAAFRPFTKLSVMVGRPQDLTEAIRRAMKLALTPPCGPVHLTLPMDVQMGDVGSPAIPEPLPLPMEKGLSKGELSVLSRTIKEKRGVLFAGSGVKKARASENLLKLAERSGWPVVTTPAGKGTIPESHPLARGVFGLSGNQAARDAVASAEAILVLGSSLGELATSNWSPLLGDKILYQIDHDPAVMGKRYENTLPFQAGLKAALIQLSLELPESSLDVEPSARETSFDGIPLHLSALNHLLPQDTMLCSDIGEHMTWALRYWETTCLDGFDITINYGGMGSGIANAIGVKLAMPWRPIVCVTGDGCFAMHGNEVMTAVQQKLPVMFVVINNASYGMVKWGHQLQYERAPHAFSYSMVNVAAMAQAMGALSFKVSRAEDWQGIDLPVLLSGEVPVVVELFDKGIDTPPMADRVAYLKGRA